MLNTTLSKLCCPICRRALTLHPMKKTALSADVFEVTVGHLACGRCQENFPILSGVAILVTDVQSYIAAHAKGISAIVPDSEIPREFLNDYKEAKSELEIEHIEEDLEAERVNALYLMNHYLSVSGGETGSSDSRRDQDWWKSKVGTTSPLIDTLVREYWDKSPLAHIANWVKKLPSHDSVIEIGCGVGGLSRMLARDVKSYLGVDSAFASIALARHLALGTSYPREIMIPNDLLQGSVSLKLSLGKTEAVPGAIDFVVGEIESLPVVEGDFDVSIALNAIDMLNEPEGLPKLQKALVKKGGTVIQSCPYIWHSVVTEELRKILPPDVKDSAKAVEWLYEDTGLQIFERVEHLPWLFFKQVRQLEIYSVHLFMARK